MKQHPDPEHLRRIVRGMKTAAIRGVYSGLPSDQSYLMACSRVDTETGANLIYTRDTGHHSSGWLKNPDYERCWHLSTSQVSSGLLVPDGRGKFAPVTRELDRKIKRAWVEAFFGEDLHLVWFESAKSARGRELEVRHWRLFADERWQPILPRGEVYSTELTEIGWRSASQVWEEDHVLVTSTVDPD